MKNGNRYSFNPRRKIIPQIVAMRTGKFGYTLIVHLASNLIGPNIGGKTKSTTLLSTIETI